MTKGNHINDVKGKLPRELNKDAIGNNPDKWRQRKDALESQATRMEQHRDDLDDELACITADLEERRVHAAEEILRIYARIDECEVVLAGLVDKEG